MIKRSERGFTLIELLVVIAIIGILAAIILASLNTARDKGADAAVKSDVDGIRDQAEIVYSGSNNYSAVCTDATIVKQMQGAAGSIGIATTSIETTLGSAGDSSHVVCHVSSGNDAYVVEAPMKTSGQYWCVDSTGISAEVTTALAGGDTACPSS